MRTASLSAVTSPPQWPKMATGARWRLSFSRRIRWQAFWTMARKTKQGATETNRGHRHVSMKLAILSFASVSLGVQLLLLIKERVMDVRRLGKATTQRLAHPLPNQSATIKAASYSSSKSTVAELATSQNMSQEPTKPIWTFSSSWGSQAHLEAIIREASKAHRKKSFTASVAFYYTKISRVVVAHTPRYDLLGSFVRPTLFLLAIARFYRFELEILPFQGSLGEATLKRNLALGAALDERWGSGYQDVSNRPDYDPVEMNIHAYDILGVFPKVSPSASEHEWIQSERIPEDGVELHELCHRHSSTNNTCYIQIPGDNHMVEQFVDSHGCLDDFFPIEFRSSLREKFLARNMARLKRLEYDMGAYNVVVHVRRGDINHPRRWIDQAVYHKIVHNICQLHKEARVHIFSAGRNLDTNWTTLEGLSDVCSEVIFHLDENEFDSWAYMVAANVLVMAPSSFSLIPALLNTNDVYFPRFYLESLGLTSWKVFDPQSGELVKS